MMTFPRAVRCCIFLIALADCSGSINGLPVYSGIEPLPRDAPDYQTRVQLQYLGAGGWLIRRGEQMLLTAPFFSNPSLKRVMFWHINSRPEQSDRFLSPMRQTLQGVKAVLVGHAHYDHLLDLPYIKRRYTPQAKVYGSQTAAHILAADPAFEQDELVVVENHAGTANCLGKWWYVGGRIRFMALISEHAPHAFGVKVFNGEYRDNLKALPGCATAWREGQTLAYLIDFMGEDGQAVEFRIYYQDAASTPPLGFPPLFNLPPQDQRRPDVAILCMPGFDQVKGYPEEIIEYLQPRVVAITHWENFFQTLPDDPQKLRTVPLMDAGQFIERMKKVLPPDAAFRLPAPGALMGFDP